MRLRERSPGKICRPGKIAEEFAAHVPTREPEGTKALAPGSVVCALSEVQLLRSKPGAAILPAVNGLRTKYGKSQWPHDLASRYAVARVLVRIFAALRKGNISAAKDSFPRHGRRKHVGHAPRA